MRQDDIRKIIFHHLFLYLMFAETYGHCSVIVLRDPTSMGQETWHFDCSKASNTHKPKNGYTSLLKHLKFPLAHHFDQKERCLLKCHFWERWLIKPS